ncbi:MAG: hypothetical protein ACOCV8_05250 [Spirochaetota bacterium]
MKKDTVIEYGIMIAANELKIEPIDYAIDYEGILKDNDLMGIYNPDKRLIFINGDWLEKANYNDILLVVFHEMRHYYQRIQIDLLYKELISKEETNKVKIWKKEFNQYHSPCKSNQDVYVNQAIEKDAIRFSCYLIKKIQSL